MAGDNVNKPSENQEKSKKQNNTESKIALLNAVCENNMQDKSKKNEFLDSIFLEGKVPEDEINKLLNEDSNISMVSGKLKFEGYKNGTLKITDFKNKLAGEYITLKENRNSLLLLIEGEFNLEKGESSKLEDEVQKLSDKELLLLISSDKKQSEFLKTIFGKNIKRYVTDHFPSLYSITKEEYEEKLSNLNESDKDEVIKIFASFKRGYLVNEDLKSLFKTNFLDTYQKQEIIEKVIPTISLGDIKKLNLISIDEITGLENKFKIKYLPILEGLDDKQKQDIFREIDINDIFIETSSIVSEGNISKISEGIGFKNIEEDFREYKKEVKESQEKEGIKNISEFKNELKENKVGNLEKLKKDAIFKVTISGKTKEDDTYHEEYFRIDDFDKESGGLSVSIIGAKKGKEGPTQVNLEGVKTSNISYEDVINSLKNNETSETNFSVDILSDKEFEGLLKDDEEFVQEKSDYKAVTKEDLETNDELQKEIEDNLKEKFTLDLNDLITELNSLNTERKNLKEDSSIDDKEKSNKIEILDTKIKNLEIAISEKKGTLSSLDDGTMDIDDLLYNSNLIKLLEKIDGLDEAGKSLGIKKGIVLDTKNGSYEITGINENQTIELKGFSGTENLTFEEFYEAFKKNKAQRFEKINTFEEIISKNSWGDNFNLKDGKLIQKDVEVNGKKENKTIDYLVSEKGELMKIVSIGNGEVEVIFGEYNEGKEDEKTKKTKNKITLENNSTTLSLNHFNKLIKDEKFGPDWKVGSSYTLEGSDGFVNDISSSAMTRFWNKTSFKELYMSGEMLIGGIQEYFKKGNDVKAAEFALKWAKFLPKEVEEDFITQTEMKSQEAMDKELTALTKIGSGMASLRVLKWLKNKDTPEHKKEAGLMFVSKYGILYPKKLANYNGTFLWYEALGGKIGDERYEKEKAKAEAGGLPFDEKELLIGLLGAQSGGFGTVKRRSKFFKEFKGKIAGGYGEEYGDGYKDAQDKRNIEDIIDGGFGEIEGGTIPNGLGWAKRAVEKGGSLKQMNELYFSLVYSGALYNAPGKILEELKNHWSGEGNAMIIAAFGASLSGQKLFNKTVRSISKKIEAVEPSKCKGMADEAEKLFNRASNVGDGDYKKKVEAASKFWNKYGDVLSRTLFMADGDEKDSEFGKTDKLIAFGKDDEYKDYYDYIKGWTAQGSAFKKDFMEDEVGPSGVTGLGNYEIVSKFFIMSPARTFRSDHKTAIDLMWPKIWGDVVTTKNKIANDPANEENYRKYLGNKLREISAGLISGAGKEFISTLDIVDPAGLDLGSIGITLSDFKSFRTDDILNGSAGKEIFNRAVDNVIAGKFSGKEPLDESKVFGVKEDTQKAVNNTMYNPDEDEIAS